MTIFEQLKAYTNLKVVYCDLFDTLIHRSVHPNFVYKLWAKLMIRELGLTIDIHYLYDIRKSAVKLVCEKENLLMQEIPYELTILEVYNRLINNDLLKNVSYKTFKHSFKEADYLSEIHIQFINKKLISELSLLKENQYEIFLVSDFYLPESTIKRILHYHGIEKLFSGIYVSTDYGKSKERGNLYSLVLDDTKLNASETIMIGDNKQSDYINAKNHNLHAIHLNHFKHKYRNKLNLFGDDKKAFNAICRKTELRCRKSDHPFSEYILYFYFFTERLYMEAKKKNIKNLFFLAREGLYLKKLFDHYQESNGLIGVDRIETHYFKASRQSAIQTSLMPLEQETFKHFNRKFGIMSIKQFLESLQFSDEVIELISEDMGKEVNDVFPDFVKSGMMSRLRKNKNFIKYYDLKRLKQKKMFTEYLNSFDVDIQNEGMVLIDVGWGGTMQECIHTFLEGTINVVGYYLGLRQVYHIKAETKRFGLNFSVYPSPGFSDNILLANTQLYEQLLAAPHGSTNYYTSKEEGYTFEYHEENEKKIFENFIFPIQEFMFEEYKILTQELKSIIYSQAMTQTYITRMAIRLGLLTNTKKLKFVHLISQGFYQNIGNNKVGLKYDPKDLKIRKRILLKQFLLTPEITFKYLVKVKPMLYDKGKLWLGMPINLAYYYIYFNRWLKRKLLKKQLIK